MILISRGANNTCKPKMIHFHPAGLKGQSLKKNLSNPVRIMLCKVGLTDLTCICNTDSIDKVDRPYAAGGMMHHEQ